jgi:hypothetical protein
MDFYLDEQLPKKIANALDILEQHEAINRVFSTETEFTKGVKDPALYPLLKQVNGILITHDLKMITRANEFSLIKELGVTVFVISLPGNVNFELMWETIFGKWSEIKRIAHKTKHPFVCRLTMRGKPAFL